jgi:predicted nucleic acid-binding protein
LVTIFVDTAVMMYAAGREHPLREPCRRLLEGVVAGSVTAVTSVEVVQEIVHRYVSIGQPALAVSVARSTLDLFAPVLPITHALMRRVSDLTRRYPLLAARDLVHVATCIHEGINEIVSPDRGFDAVTELRRIDPSEIKA